MVVLLLVQSVLLAPTPIQLWAISRCATCPWGTTTASTGSVDSSACSVPLTSCPKGYYNSNNACVACDAAATTPGYGLYLECYAIKSCPSSQYDEGVVMGGNCAYCPLGKYAETDDEARTACTDCPHGKTTSVFARSEDEWHLPGERMTRAILLV